MSGTHHESIADEWREAGWFQRFRWILLILIIIGGGVVIVPSILGEFQSVLIL